MKGMENMSVNDIGTLLILKSKYREVMKEDGVEWTKEDEQFIEDVVKSNKDLFKLLADMNQIVFTIATNSQDVTVEAANKYLAMLNEAEEAFTDGVDVVSALMKNINIVRNGLEKVVQKGQKK